MLGAGTGRHGLRGGVVEEASALAVGVPTWEGAALEQGHPHREPNSPPCSGHPRRL